MVAISDEIAIRMAQGTIEDRENVSDEWKRLECAITEKNNISIKAYVKQLDYYYQRPLLGTSYTYNV